MVTQMDQAGLILGTERGLLLLRAMLGAIDQRDWDLVESYARALKDESAARVEISFTTTVTR